MTEMNTVFEYEAPARDGSEACQAISARPMYWRPTYLETSAWIEHVPFAFWLMVAHRPKVFVELGSHYGMSYFAFCQAAERLGLDTRCFAVDTWKGDEHAGFYQEEVYTRVRRYNEANYSGFSRLVRSTFDEALGHFGDGSIDLLHIDGLHTYEAVRHDFESWLPKLTDNAVVIMHDTNVRERNFGVFRLFEELRKKYPSFEFVHGHGLGILSLKPAQSPLLQRLFELESDMTGKPVVQEMFSRLGRACADSLAAVRNQETAGKYKGEVTKHTKQIEDLKLALDKSKADFTNRSKELNETRTKLQKQAEENAGERAQLVERVTLLEQLRKELKDDTARLQARIDHLEASAASRIDELRRAEALALSHKHALAEADAGHERQLERLNAAIAAAKDSGEQQAGQIAVLQSRASELEAEIAGLQLARAQERAQYQAELAALVARSAVLESETAGLKLAQDEHEREIAVRQEALEQARLHGEQSTAALQLAEQEIERLASVLKLAHAEHEREIVVQQEALQQARLHGEQSTAALQLAEQEVERLASLCRAHSEENARLASDLAQAREGDALQAPALLRAPEESGEPEAPVAGESGMQELSKENAALRAENQKLAANVEARFRELAKLTQMLTAKDESLHMQKREAAALANRLAASEKVRKESQQTSENMKSQLRKGEETLLASEEQLRRLQDQLRKSGEQRSASNEDLRESAAQLRMSGELMQEREDNFPKVARPLAQPEAQHDVPSAKVGSLARLKNALGGWKVDRQKQKLARQAALLRGSGLFEDTWYLSHYPDVEKSKMDPAVHYLRFGADERRDPGPLFSTDAYVTNYPDVAESGINPLVHYINHGSKEARTISGSKVK